MDFPYNFYLKYLKTIGGINFTSREVDIMACILRRKSYSAPFLQIAQRTTETHLRNIMRKISGHSRNHIIDFIESSGCAADLDKYYQIKLVLALFEKHLNKISTLNHDTNIRCEMLYWRKKEDENVDTFIINFEKHLKSLKINTIKIMNINDNFFSQKNFSKGIYYIVFIASHDIDDQLNKEISNLLKQQQFNLNNFFFLTSNKHNSSLISEKIKNARYCECIFEKSYYFIFLEILKGILPSINIDPMLEEFTKQYKANVSSEPYYSQNIKKKYFERFYKNKNFFKLIYVNLLITLGIIILSWAILFLLPNDLFNIIPRDWTRPNTMRSNLIIPSQDVLLIRDNLIDQIKKKLDNKEKIKNIILIGLEGAGKTTLARYYSNLQNSSIIWIINAENKNTLLNSFKELAYHFDLNTVQKNKMSLIEDIKNVNEKDKQIIYFVKECLKKSSDWLLIYDNVEMFSDIKDYFPYDSEVWGRGTAIIITRNSNLRNTSYIKPEQVIDVGALTTLEAYTLFQKIICNCDSDILSASQKKAILRFLKTIPPFPLDVAMAAYYIKNTKITYEEYIYRISKNNESFNLNQENFMKEVSDYTKTRYSIINLAINNLIKIDYRFGEILLFICMLNYKDIPIALINIYQDNIIIENLILNLKKYSLISNTVRKDAKSFISVSSSHIQDIMLKNLRQVLENNLSSITVLVGRVLEKYMNNVITEEKYCQMTNLIVHGKRFLGHGKLLNKTTTQNIERELGGLYLSLGQYIKAQKILEVSLGDINQYSPSDYNKIIRFFSYLGNVYKEMGEYEKSKKILEKILSIYKLYFPQDYMGLAQILLDLGDLYRLLGENIEAEISINAGLEIYNKQLNKDHPKIGTALLTLSNVHKDLAKAKILLQKALQIYENNYGKNHIKVAIALRHLGEIFFIEGIQDKAEDILNEALKIFKQSNHTESFKCLELLGDLYLKKSHNTDSLSHSKDWQYKSHQYFTQAFQIVSANFPTSSPYFIRVKSKINK